MWLLYYFRNVRQWRQRNRNQKKTEEQEVKEESNAEKENENTNNNVSDGDTNEKEEKDIKVEKDSSQERDIPKPSEDIDIIDNTECKFNVNSFKLVYVVNSESYLYKRMALKRAKEVCIIVFTIIQV